MRGNKVNLTSGPSSSQVPTVVRQHALADGQIMTGILHRLKRGNTLTIHNRKTSMISDENTTPVLK